MNVERFGADFWFTLWKKLECAFQGILDLSSLQDLLLKEKSSFVNPLRALPPNTESKKQVESGNIVIHGLSHKLNAPFIKQHSFGSERNIVCRIVAFGLSKGNNVSHLITILKQSRFPETEAPSIAEQLYFKERRYWLYSVLSLFRIRLATDLPEDMRSFISQYTNELVADGLPGNICKMLMKLTKETKDSRSMDILNFKNEERKLLSEIIFFIYYQYTATSEDVFQLVNILNESSLQICRRKDTQETNAESNSYQIAYTQTFAILCSLDVTHGLIDAKTNISTPNPLLKDSAFKDKFDKTIRGTTWDESTFQSVVTLGWAVFLGEDTSSNPSVKIDDVILDSIKKRGSILNIINVIKHRKFQVEKELKEVYVGVLHDLLNIFLQDLNIWDKPDTDDSFIQLLQLISLLYKNQPTFAIKYWETNHLQYFIRFAGEKVNSNIFVHYIRMLASLSTSSECSQHVYHYLKISVNKYVNWDHFFAVFDHYYTDFQQSQQESLSVEPSYYYGGSNFAPSMTRIKTRPDMRPEDVMGLLAILNLVEEVVAHSEHTRILLFENPSWHVIESLFRLLACPIQASLKGGILSTLVAFAKSAEIVPKIWLYLEASQLLPTQTNIVGGTATIGGTFNTANNNALQKSNVEGGIKFELEEIEARSQEYPETIAFLKLIEQLVSFTIPLSLGSSHRTPGFNPYLAFIRDSVFLKFDVRGYKNPTQQWIVSTYCLRIFYKIIQQYDFPVTDFKDAKGGLTSANSMKSPGFELFKSILTGSQLTLKFFWIFENAVAHLEELRYQENGDYFEESVQLTLQILYLVFSREELFGEYIRTYIPSILLSPLHDLLLRHRQCVVNIALLVGYKLSSKIPYLAAKIFYELSTRQISDKVVDILIDSDQAIPVIQAFVDKLETEEDAQNDENLEEDILYEEIQTTKSVRLVILEMLLVSLDSTSSKLAHFLLGFNLSSVSDTDLDYSSVSGCFHLIVSLVENTLLSQSSPLLAQLCYELLYQLCYNTDTTRPTMRFLRTHDFYTKQLNMLYASNLNSSNLNYYLFNQWAWFIKILTLELHTTSSTDNKYKLLSILFQSPLYNEDISTDLDVSYKQSMSVLWEQQRMKIIEILDVVFVSIEEPPSRRPSTLFNSITLDPLINTNKHGIALIDVKKFYILLTEEKKKLEFSNNNIAPQSLHSQMTEELNYVIKKNHYQELFSSLVFMFDSWKQLIQIILFKSYDYLRKYGKESILYELLETLLKKYSTVDLKTPLSMPISTVVVTIMAKLRQRRQIYESTMNEYELPVDQLHRILNGIVQALIHPATTQSIRANFYAALLNYLNLYQISEQSLINNQSSNAEKDQLHLIEGNYTIIQGYSDKLLHIICEDASSSSDTWRIVAFSLLDILMKYDRKQEWLLRIFNSGFLANYLNDIKTEESELMKLLTPNPESLKILYVYESKLSFFISIANNSIRGSSLLVDMGVINQFTQLQIIDQRPEDTVIEHTDWLPPVIQRYNSLLQPILRLMLSLLTNLPKNMDLHSQLLNFVLEHFDLISTLLKDRAPVLTEDSLNTLKLITSIFYYLCQNESLMLQKLQNRGAHLTNLLINLLSTYCIKERWEPRLRHYKVNSILDVSSTSSATPQTNSIVCEKLVQDICKNLIGTARILCESSLSNNIEDTKSNPNRVLFTAHLASILSSSDSLSFAPKSEQDVPLSVTNKWRPPSLSILVNYLKQTMDQYFTIIDDIQLLQSKLDHLSEQSPDDISELAIQVSRRKEETLSLQQRTVLAEVRLYDLLQSSKAQQNTLFYIIENSLLILWRHLFYYLEPVRSGKSTQLSSDPNSKTSIGELMQLKQDMNLLLSSPNALPKFSESILTLLSKIEKTKKPNIIYFLLRQLKDLLVTQ